MDGAGEEWNLKFSFLAIEGDATNDGKLALYGSLELEEEMYCHNLGLVPRVRIYFDDLNDFLPKPTNETGVRPMKSRFPDFGETFFFLGETFWVKKGQKREQK